VIVPAHNEAAVIARTIETLLRFEQPLEILVVCNACQDATATQARRFEPRVTVLETEQAGKARAINLGESKATVFPRIYLDADIALEPAAVARILETLREPGVLAASAKPRLCLKDAATAVCRFYRVDQEMPSHRGGIGGSGVYAVNETGRSRWESFPNIIADDAFVRRHFREGERVIADGAETLVVVPRTLRGLIKIKTRSHLGNAELAVKFPQLTANRGASNRPALLRLLARPWRWGDLATYLYVKSVSRARARKQLPRLLDDDARNAAPVWERDESSRNTGKLSVQAATTT
jgi:glycosyltransferase involved in cell wall biosynthesis